jgi:hypothetical protein
MGVTRTGYEFCKYLWSSDKGYVVNHKKSEELFVLIEIKK